MAATPTPPDEPFEGFPDEAFAFYEGLAADNTKTYWAAHKQAYQRAVREPMIALLAELAAEFGPGHVFRPHRDVRFSKEKTPYKDHQGGFVEVGDAVGYYVQVNADGLLVAGGWYSPQGAQLARFRDVVDGPSGAELERIIAEVEASGYDVGGDRLKTRPRGIDADHPRLDLLRYRSVTAARSFEPEPWLSTRGCLDRVRSGWRAMAPLVEWLAASVGPGEDAGERRR